MQSSVALVVLFAASGLGDGRFAERERSQTVLTATLPVSIPYLKAATKSQDTETSARARNIIGSWCTATAFDRAAKLRPANWPRLPWIDSLPNNHCERKHIIGRFLSEAQQRIGRRGPPEWEDCRLATRLYFASRLRWREVQPSDTRLLEDMVKSEKEWIKQHGHRYTPPIELPPNR